MIIKAYAKVNLGLKVYKGMDESKHKIDSIFYLYKKLYDTIRIKKSDSTKVSFTYLSNKKPKYEENLVARSLLYLNKKFGWDINYDIKIIKRIPVGSGLGGSSSDAAAVICYILSKNQPVILDLKDIALNLGSDIPFFLSHYQMARVTMYGNIVAPIYNWKPKIQVHLNNLDCSTQKIFEALEADKNYKSNVNIDNIIINAISKSHKDIAYNDLHKYIIQSNIDINNLYSNIKGTSFFSGSGPTIITIKE